MQTVQHKRRIAFFGPLPPGHTGIAEYDERLIPLLRQHYELDVYVGGKPDGQLLDVFSHSDFYFRHKHDPYDTFIYQLGNNARFHEYMYGYLFQYPGAVVFHDYCLHHSRAGMLLNRGMRAEYRDELEFCHGEQDTEKIARIVEIGAGGEQLLFSFPMTRLVLESSLAAAAHLTEVAKLLQITETPVIRIPHLKLGGGIESSEDPFPGKFVIGSFGFATRPKRHRSVIEAVTHLRRFYPNVMYLIAGDVEGNYALHDMVKYHGLQDNVRITGRLEIVDFLKLLARADVIVNLRFPSGGEMSGALIRSMVSGKPILISKLPYFSEIPEDTVISIRPNREVEDLVRHLANLIEEPRLRARLSTAAKRHVEENHSDEKVVESYRELIEMALSRQSTFSRPSLPGHLNNAEEILRGYISRTAFGGKNLSFLDQLKSNRILKSEI